MTASKHAKFVIYSFLTWLIFYLIGWPDYYQSWPFWFQFPAVAYWILQKDSEQRAEAT